MCVRVCGCMCVQRLPAEETAFYLPQLLCVVGDRWGLFAQSQLTLSALVPSRNLCIVRPRAYVHLEALLVGFCTTNLRFAATVRSCSLCLSSRKSSHVNVFLAFRSGLLALGRIHD
jgi:hypothetical protein